jgi:HAD superfamily hydrolase (TIGR01509 family)
MIRAVIFDMDGLLVDSEVYWEEARRAYCAEQGCTWRPEDELTVKGNNSREWAEAIQQRCAWKRDPQAIIDAVTVQMEDQYRRHLPLLPGATETVRDLARQYPLAIASSSPPALIEFAMSEAGILDRFGEIVSADHVGRGKPAPDVFLVAAERLGIAPNSCAVFEDSSAGILAARAANMFVIAVPNPHYPPHEEALQAADLALGSLLEFRSEMLPSGTAEPSSSGLDPSNG